VASGMGELDHDLHDGDSPQALFERVGGHGLRMLSMHYGAQVFHAATEGVIQREEALAHARLEAKPQAKKSEIPNKPIQNPPLTPEEARAGLSWMENPLVAMGMMMLGVDGLGGWEGRGREIKNAPNEASPDPQLKLLNEELLQLQIKNPDDPAVQEHWAVITDYLQSRGNPQGDLIFLELERLSRIARGETDNLASLMKKIVGVRKDIEREINHRLGYKNIFIVDFFPSLGFCLSFAGQPNGGYSTAIEKFFSSEFSQLFRGLVIADRNITIEELQSIIGLKGIRDILSLHLSCCYLGDDGAVAIAKSENLRNLKSLNLRTNRIGDDGALAIANSETLRDLELLDLFSNRISDDGALAIAKSKSLLNLKSLTVASNEINEELEQIVATSLPNLVEFFGQHIRFTRPPRENTSSSQMFLAGPALLGAEIFQNGHPTVLGIILGGITTLLSSGKVREQLLRTAQRMTESLFKAKGEISSRIEPTETSLLAHPLLAPLWLALGSNGAGGWGGRQGEKKKARPEPSRIPNSNGSMRSYFRSASTKSSNPSSPKSTTLSPSPIWKI
ncbi:MAG: hypothetical protein K8R69_12640, partial [Deltaproteobacteria bacterium]|nr:hypothetical protein [Deltaproteobacteria bacterium]